MKNEKIPIILFIAVLIVLSLGTTYAYLNLGANAKATGTVGCFTIDYVGEVGNYNGEEDILESSENYNDFYKQNIEDPNSEDDGYATVTVSKNANCKIYDKVNIYLFTNYNGTSKDLFTTYPQNPAEDRTALKYVVVDESKIGTEENAFVGEGPIVVDLSNWGTEGVAGESTLLTTVDLTDTAKTYRIYIWVDNSISYGGSVVYDKLTYSGYIYADATQSSTYTG